MHSKLRLITLKLRAKEALNNCLSSITGINFFCRENWGWQDRENAWILQFWTPRFDNIISSWFLLVPKSCWHFRLISSGASSNVSYDINVRVKRLPKDSNTTVTSALGFYNVSLHTKLICHCCWFLPSHTISAWRHQGALSNVLLQLH